LIVTCRRLSVLLQAAQQKSSVSAARHHAMHRFIKSKPSLKLLLYHIAGGQNV
jgi:hypothetical protein